MDYEEWLSRFNEMLTCQQWLWSQCACCRTKYSLSIVAASAINLQRETLVRTAPAPLSSVLPDVSEHEVMLPSPAPLFRSIVAICLEKAAFAWPVGDTPSTRPSEKAWLGCCKTERARKSLSALVCRFLLALVREVRKRCRRGRRVITSVPNAADYLGRGHCSSMDLSRRKWESKRPRCRRKVVARTQKSILTRVSLLLRVLSLPQSIACPFRCRVWESSWSGSR